MRKKSKKFLKAGIVVIIAFFAVLYFRGHVPTPGVQTGEQLPPKPITFINLPVPFIFEAPDGVFKKPWNNACEEATITMIEKFYEGKESVSIAEQKEFMQMLFTKQDQLYGSNANSDAARTADLINTYTNFKATIKDNPTIEDIKKELIAGHPVMTFNYGFALKNKNIPFLASGSSYHTLVIKGFDEDKKQWITNDDGDETAGKDHRYDYQLFMGSLHDYVYATAKANGTPRVIFTTPK